MTVKFTIYDTGRNCEALKSEGTMADMWEMWEVLKRTDRTMGLSDTSYKIVVDSGDGDPLVIRIEPTTAND